jgi:hypothetical protein
LGRYSSSTPTACPDAPVITGCMTRMASPVGREVSATTTTSACPATAARNDGSDTETPPAVDPSSANTTWPVKLRTRMRITDPRKMARSVALCRRSRCGSVSPALSSAPSSAGATAISSMTAAWASPWSRW